MEKKWDQRAKSWDFEKPEVKNGSSAQLNITENFVSIEHLIDLEEKKNGHYF